MSRNTTTFALPRAMRESIRRDQERQARKRLRELIEEGLNSGPGSALTLRRAARLEQQALGDLR